MNPSRPVKKLHVLLPFCLVIGAACGEDAFRRTLVVSQITLPLTKDDKAVDQNGDGLPDNRLGAVLGILNPLLPAINRPQAMMDRLIQKGQYLALLDLHGDDHDRLVLAVAMGRDLDKDATDNFLGQETFTREAADEPVTPLPAILAEPALSAGPGTIALLVPLGLAYPELALRQTRITGVFSDDGRLQGRITGAIPLAGSHDSFYYSLAVSLRSLANDPATSSSLKAFVQTLDTDGDGLIEVSDLENSALVRLLAAPDLDLDSDGTADALSAGLGFTATPCAIAE